jgi:hypothetical protein
MAEENIPERPKRARQLSLNNHLVILIRHFLPRTPPGRCSRAPAIDAICAFLHLEGAAPALRASPSVWDSPLPPPPRAAAAPVAIVVAR